MNNNLSKIRPSLSMTKGLQGKTAGLTNLSIGVPDISCPEVVVELIRELASKREFGYVASRGTPQALQNLKELLFVRSAEIKPEKNLMLVNGAKYGIYLALKTLCNPGNSILLLEPFWLSYPDITSSLGLNTITCSPAVSSDGGTHYDLQKLHRILDHSKISVVVINNPNNPSGKILSKQWLDDLNKLLVTKGIWLLIDEVYKDLVFDSAKESEFDLYADNIVRVGSLSKSLSIPGMRLGYICGPERLIGSADLFNQHIQTCVNSLACRLLEHLPVAEFRKFVALCSKEYKDRYRDVGQILRETKLKLLKSEASFYGMVDFSEYFPSGEEACEFLLSKLKILAVPGRPYGDSFATYVRICFTLPRERLKEQFALIAKNLSE